MTLTPGSQLGNFRIVSLLGAGGMGEVYRARDMQLDRDVALKVLPAPFATDAERLHRFEREAKSLAALNHPNIAQVFGIVPAAAGHAPAIAMEFVDGRSLDAVTGPMALDELVPIARQIAAAFEAAHDSGIVHRDLKPANIKVRDDGTVKVLDFGLAKALDPTSGADASGAPTITSPATGIGIILGTAAYMSPEQARGRAVDRRADIWAFGVVLFELITGGRLFQGDTVSDTIAAVLRQDIPWDRLPPSTPPGLRRLLRHCLEREPRSRLKDAGDIRIELDDLSGKPTDEIASAVAPPAPAPRASRWIERSAWAALAVGGIGLGWWLGSARQIPADTAWSQFTQLTDEAGRETTPAISPDGDSIAYASDVSGSWDIYVRRIGGRTATPVAADPSRDEGAPAFSPDGRTIAFHEADADGGIFIVGATGESVRRIADAGFHPAWSPDGRTIAFCQERIVLPQSRVIVSALSVVDVTTGAVRVVTPGDAVQPVFSPSGERLAYWANSAGQRDIYTIALTGGAPVKLTDDAALDWATEWAPDGEYLYFASDRGGAMNLWRIPLDERSGAPKGAPEPVTNGVQIRVAKPSFSKDGRRLVFSSELASSNPVAFPIDATGKVGEPRFLFRRNGQFEPSSVSPDGSLLAYFVTDSREDIWVGSVDGTGLRRVTDDDYRDRAPMWSADGSEILFYSNRSGKYELWTVKKDGSGLTQLSNRPKDSLNWGFYDPAGRRAWANVGSGEGAGSYTFPLIAKSPQEGVKMPAIPVEGGMLRPHGITRDGKRLVGLALSSAGTRLGIGWHDLGTGETWVSRDGHEFGLPAWLDEQRAVFVLDRKYFATIDTSKRRQIIGGPFSFDLNSAGLPAVSPDKRTVFVGATATESDVWMVERERR